MYRYTSGAEMDLAAERGRGGAVEVESRRDGRQPRRPTSRPRPNLDELNLHLESVHVSILVHDCTP